MFPADGDLNMFDIAVDRAQNWYNVQAEQRMRLMYFYIVLLAGNLALLGAASNGNNRSMMLLVGIGLIFLSAVFKLFDRRTAVMIKIAEAALRKLEEKIADETQISEMRLIDNHEMSNSISYRLLFNALYIFGTILGLFAIFRSFLP